MQYDKDLLLYFVQSFAILIVKIFRINGYAQVYIFFVCKYW